MVTVKVVRQSSGNPVEGAKVKLGIDEFFSRGVTSGVHTDSKGEAHFDIKPGQGEVFVNGRTEYKGHLSGRIVVYV